MNVVSYGAWAFEAADAMVFALVVLSGAVILLLLALRVANASDATLLAPALLAPVTMPIPQRDLTMRASYRVSADMPSRAPPDFHPPADSPHTEPAEDVDG